MKPAQCGFWVMDSDARYVRILASMSGAVAADVLGNGQKTAPLWRRSEKSLHLDTAYSLQPTLWWLAQ